KRIREVVKATGTILTVGATSTALLHPTFSAKDRAGNVFIPDVGHNRIQRYTVPAPVVVSPDATTTSLTTQVVRDRHGKLVALRLAAQIEAAAPGSGVATGTVTFFVNGRVLATEALSDGTVVVTIKPKRVLKKTVTIAYSGDADFQSSASPGAVITPKSLRTMARPMGEFLSRGGGWRDVAVKSVGSRSAISLVVGNRTQGQGGHHGLATGARFDGSGVVAKRSMTPAIRDLPNGDRDRAPR